jgi:hypothetical protein
MAPFYRGDVYAAPISDLSCDVGVQHIEINRTLPERFGRRTINWAVGQLNPYHVGGLNNTSNHFPIRFAGLCYAKFLKDRMIEHGEKLSLPNTSELAQ